MVQAFTPPQQGGRQSLRFVRRWPVEVLNDAAVPTGRVQTRRRASIETNFISYGAKTTHQCAVVGRREEGRINQADSQDAVIPCRRMVGWRWPLQTMLRTLCAHHYQLGL